MNLRFFVVAGLLALVSTPASGQQKLSFEGERRFVPYAVSVSGNIAVIGVTGIYDDQVDEYKPGVAYVYVRDGASWVEQARLTASDAVSDDNFGVAVAIDGDVIVVGANRPQAPIKEGAAYVFERSGDSWTERARLSDGDGLGDEWFGYTVAVSKDTVLVGASREHGALNDSGAAYIFVRNSNSWEQQQRIVPLDPQYAHHFGESVALSGETALVAALNDNNGAGAAYVFERDAETWTEQTKLKPPDGMLEFGCSISISGDKAVVGVPGPQKEGIAYVYGGDNWAKQAEVATKPQPNGVYPIVSLSGDLLVIGAHSGGRPGQPSASAGAAFAFVHQGGAWVPQPELKTAAAQDQLSFGIATAASADNVLVAGNNGVFAFSIDGVAGVDAGVESPDASPDAAPDDRDGGPSDLDNDSGTGTDSDSSDGCSCATSEPPPVGVWLVLLLAFAAGALPVLTCRRPSRPAPPFGVRRR